MIATRQEEETLAFDERHIGRLEGGLCQQVGLGVVAVVEQVVRQHVLHAMEGTVNNEAIGGKKLATRTEGAGT